MNAIRWIICAALAGSTPATAFAQDAQPAATDTPAATPKPKPKSRMICTSERETGSFVKVQRTCATQEDLDRQQQENQREFDRRDRTSAFNGGNAGPQ